MRPADCNIERKNFLFSLFGLDLFSVRVQGDRRQIRVHLYPRHLLRSVCVPAVTDVDERLVAPVRFIQVERVLLMLSVKTHQPFLI